MTEIPTCIEDLSKEWLHKTLSEALKVKNIEILELKPISSIGYLSQALKATFKVKDSDHPEKIFIKINLSDDSHFTFVGKHGIYLAEIRSYQEILPALIKYEIEQFGKSKLKKLIPTYFCFSLLNFFLQLIFMIVRFLCGQELFVKLLLLKLLLKRLVLD